MRKPDGIPQDVWDATSDRILYARRSPDYELMDDLEYIELVSRAILAERERLAMKAELVANEWDENGHNDMFAAEASALRQFSASIRKGEP